MAKRIARGFGLTPGAWQFDEDTENLFPDHSPMENLEDAASGARDIQPRKYLQDRQYGKPTEPLIVLPEYTGDFLDKLRAEFKNKCADSLLDFAFPDEKTKYLPDVVPRDLQDEWYDINRPGEGAGYTELQDYHDRGWDENDAPEISEDKILRMRNFNKNLKCPCLDPVKPESAERVINAFVEKQGGFHVQSVIAKFLMKVLPSAFEIDTQKIKVAKLLSYFDQSLIYTKEKGWRRPDHHGVSVRLVRAEPRAARWTFMTTSGKGSYTTIFQFIPKGSIADPNKLNVRISCTCPSWLFWGAQYNAMMEDYLYGKIRPKFTPPSKRDPTGRFLVCKHVLACIPLVSKYKVMPVGEQVKERLRKPLKVELEKRAPSEKLRIPLELKNFAKREDIKGAVKKWDEMSDRDRESFVMGLESPGAVAFMAHRFPETALVSVVKKLKEMAVKNPIPSFRVLSRRLLRDII